MIRVDEPLRPAMEGALRARSDVAMFALSNLRHGLTGDGHRHATAYWIDDAEAPGTVLGVTQAGMAMVVARGGPDVEGCAAVLRGQSLAGATGEASALRPVLTAAGLDAAPMRQDKDEPLFALDLAALALPDGSGTLAPVATDPETALRWRHAYEEELHPPAEPATETLPDWITADTHRFLMIDGAPAAMTGFNAVLSDMVQVGGVYTPPESRGRGLARRAVGLHLTEAQKAGVARAILFAASDAAVACYRPLGFERIGDYAFVLFDGEVTA